jgi:hypothetical protein
VPQPPRYQEDIGPTESDLSAIRSWIPDTVEIYLPSNDDLARAEESGALTVANELRRLRGGAVGEILYQEWLFLQSHSWLVASRKWVFGQFIRAGGVAVEVGRRAYERARSELPQLLTRQGIKRNVRWVAKSSAAFAVTSALGVGGLEHALFGGGVGLAADAALKRVFVLIDP